MSKQASQKTPRSIHVGSGAKEKSAKRTAAKTKRNERMKRTREREKSAKWSGSKADTIEAAEITNARQGARSRGNARTSKGND